MRRVYYASMSITVIVGLSVLYAIFLRDTLPANPTDFVAWILFTVIEVGMVLSIAGAYYFIPEKPIPTDIIYFETFKANLESDEPITQELEAIKWPKH